MDLLTIREGKEVWFHQMVRPFRLDPPFLGRRYVAIVFSNDKDATEAERQLVSCALFESGCRYGVFAGHACTFWETALDAACIESAPDYKPSDEAFTMTTSHEGESVEDVMFFGLMNTALISYEFDRFLVLFIGHRVGMREEVEAAIQSVWCEDPMRTLHGEI